MGKSQKTSIRSHPHISIDPWIFGIPLQEMFEFTKKVGFDGIEYMLTLRDLAFGPARVLSLSKKYDMPVTSLHQPLLLLIQTPPQLFPRMLEVPKMFPHVELVNHHLSAFMFRKPAITRALVYKKMFKQAGIVATFESNPGSGMFSLSRQYAKETYDPQAFEKFAIQHQLPINLDVCHIASRNYDIVKFFSDNHNLIKLIHLSDFKNGKQHLPLGEGQLPLRELLQEIKRKKWNGHITFEIYKFVKQKTKKEKFEALQKSLTFVHEILGN